MKDDYSAEMVNAIKNPFFDKLCRKVEITVTHKDYALYEETAKLHGERVKPEDVMKNALREMAQMIREHE